MAETANSTSASSRTSQRGDSRPVEPGEASGRNYDAMSVYDIYQVLTTLVGVRQFYNLTCCAQPTGETAVFEWAEACEAEVEAEMDRLSTNLAARLGLAIDDEDVRDMAFARIDGFVTAGIWHDGRALRMRTAADLAGAK